ncbi:tRNA (guanosine(37)-N1)-methyltransferase TrmD [Arthrobacter sp. NIO-1057]|uniref:tRNA (guanosine(37)-N1)-methyltransferase TrmD n=1 Tax=Arthrobacter sp. NIO-1057 TaxID=993071 RepID=UPI00071DB4EF|nr:tRNA (guanosine(37)-N1)-methyltransferase TrmD [Arthrobacter sp. NIO-1057]KSU67782.1 tRNA (guanine-N1)-methyltransferase [Arthrobacter sp. NIO-1057]SCB78838.1 tRNA (guanine37-N1)-methyltransferase [Arthrobacter sp. NIO-1057]
MRLDVISIFPEYLQPLSLSLIGRAAEDGILDLNVTNLRDFTEDKHRKVDDTPYGGGAGMVMMPEPWGRALDAVRPADAQGPKPTLIVPSPAGRVFDQQMAYELAEEEHLVFACGRYEGIDERVVDYARENFNVIPVSIGDYVLNGGEVAVMVMVEAIARLIPGVIGNPESLVEESHSDVLLEYPVYTKPASWRGREVPEVLLGGNHQRVGRFRRDEQIKRTAARRPDLITQMDVQSLNRRDRDALWHNGFAIVDGVITNKAELDWATGAGTEEDK